MVAISESENKNYGWQAVEHGSTFTASTPPEFIHEARAFFQSKRIPFLSKYEADEDIATGRVRRFSSAQKMLASLKKRIP